MNLRLLGGCDVVSQTGERLDAIIAQPKRLALLVYLAGARSSAPRARDRLLALFWPELDDATARHALRQSLYHLRRALGGDVVLSHGDFVELTDAVWSDVAELERALSHDRAEAALELYRGDFLDGFHAGDVSAEFNEWVDAERKRLRHRAIDGALRSATDAEQRGDLVTAEHVLRRVTELAPFDERVLRRRLEVLGRSGDRASALMAFEEFVERLRRELDLAPSPETLALAARIRTAPVPNEPVRRAAGAPARTVGGDAFLHEEEASPGLLDGPAIPAPTRSPGAPVRKVRPSSGVWMTLGMLAIVGLGVVVKSAARDPQPILAVGGIADRTGLDSLRLGLTMRGLLASELLRIRDVAVLSEGRLLEFRASADDSASEQQAMADAARRAGATDLIEGVLYRLSGDSLRLDLRRVGVESNLLRGSVTVVGRDPFAMAADAIERLGDRMRRDVLPNALAGVSTASLSARRLYQQGLQAFYELDFSGAGRFLAAALVEDSTFAMAAYQASRAAFRQNQFDRRAALLDRAVRSISHASDRERLIILAEWAEVRNDPSWRAVAETLTVRYPAEPDGAYALGRALSWGGDFVRARRLLLDAAARDSAALVARSGSAWCRACDALNDAAIAALLADSLASAETIAKRWLAVDTGSAGALAVLAGVLERGGRVDEALHMAQRAWGHIPGGVDDAEFQVRLAIRSGDYPAADRILSQRASDSRLDVRREAFWWQMISLRQQGRVREALAVARRFRSAVRDSEGDDGALESTPQEQQILMEAGAVERAIALGDSMLRAPRRPETEYAGAEWVGGWARRLVWKMTHVAESVAASGDTVRLIRLADSLEVVGRASAFGRDQKLHLHVRGLISLVRRDSAAAIRELRASIYSPTSGYTRSNYVLGRVLIARGQLRDAIEVLEPALRGDLQASNLYVTRTELYEALGDAYAAAGDTLRAREAYRKVASAWAGADVPIRSRAARAARLAPL